MHFIDFDILLKFRNINRKNCMSKPIALHRQVYVQVDFDAIENGQIDRSRKMTIKFIALSKENADITLGEIQKLANGYMTALQKNSVKFVEKGFALTKNNAIQKISKKEHEKLLKTMSPAFFILNNNKIDLSFQEDKQGLSEANMLSIGGLVLEVLQVDDRALPWHPLILIIMFLLMCIVSFCFQKLLLRFF